MLTILSAIFGFLSSGMPSLLSLFQDKQDKAHELNIMQLQIELAKLNISEQLDEIKSQENIEEIKALYATYKTGIEWIDALNGTVRPVIAYTFMFLYCFVEVAIFYSYMNSAEPTAFLVDSLWSDEDQCMLVGILAFYFGQRGFNKKS